MDLSDKTFLITGGNSGIGYETALQLANWGARVGILCRSEEKANAAVSAIRTESGNERVNYVLADLGSLGETRRAASEILIQYDRIDVLFNNAGAAVPKRHVTDDGLELNFVVNHLSGFLLTQLLLDRLLGAGGARVVFTSSVGHKHSALEFNNLNLEKGFGQLKAYGRTKLMNVLTARELQRRYGDRGIVASSFHPGAVKTDIWRKGGVGGKIVELVGGLFMLNSRQGADTMIWLGTSTDADAAQPEGRYFLKRKPAKTALFATNEAAVELWETSVKLTGLQS